MKLWHAISLIILVWAAIYLSHLGERELRGEEARRIIPAQEMIQSEQWVVPTLAGEVYGNKPPLINWVIAGSFLLTGSESEFAARLPSVLSLLALSLAAFFTLRGQFGVKRSLSVAMVLLTAGSLIEKCRMAEIESVFVALFGFACLSWIALWTSKRSPWLIWTIPYLFIGIGCLAKGPVHFIFWIFFLIPILKAAGGLRQVFHPAHLLGLFLIPLISLPWVFANLAAAEQPEETVNNWAVEMTKRAVISKEALLDWSTHPLEFLINFLPWTVPLLFSLWCLRKEKKPSFPMARWDAVTRGCFWCVVLTAGALLCLPGGLPRYLLPLYLPAAIAVVTLYFRVGEKTRVGYEKFAYFSVIFIATSVLLVIIAGTIVSVREGLAPLWGWLAFSLVLLAGAFTWLFRFKPRPGVFLSVPVFMAVTYIGITSAAIPFERERYQFRTGAARIHELAVDREGSKIFYADSDFRNAQPRHLRLLFYLPDFVHQGESRVLPDDTTFLIGQEVSLEAMTLMASRFQVEKFDLLEIDGLHLISFFLRPDPDQSPDS